MNIRTLIVDDEKPARDELHFILKHIPEIGEISEAKNAGETLELLKKNEYDVLFLDIHMPGINGIEAAKKINKTADYTPLIVFVTAYDEYAIPAYEVDAMDYILKPFDEKRVKQTIDKIKRIYQGEVVKKFSLQNKARPEQQKFGRLLAHKGKKLAILRIEDIKYAFVKEGLVFIKAGADKYTTNLNLSQLEERLTQYFFFRANRTHLVNLNYVKEIIPFFSSTYILQMDDSEQNEIPASRIQTKKLKEIFKL
ncbi:MAG: LytTR family DNA-binding domain-containing protein [bacterium]